MPDKITPERIAEIEMASFVEDWNVRLTIQELIQALRASLKDGERLDWLEKNWFYFYAVYMNQEISVPMRQVLDGAAMKKEG